MEGRTLKQTKFSVRYVLPASEPSAVIRVNGGGALPATRSVVSMREGNSRDAEEKRSLPSTLP